MTPRYAHNSMIEFTKPVWSIDLLSDQSSSKFVKLFVQLIDLFFGPICGSGIYYVVKIRGDRYLLRKVNDKKGAILNCSDLAQLQKAKYCKIS